MPSVSRPSLIWSIAAAMLARTAGCRYVTLLTREPSCTRGTAAASAAITDQHSSVGPSTGSGPWPFGMKWSAKYTPSQPVCSQCVASSRISLKDWAAVGQMLKRMRGILRGSTGAVRSGTGR